MPEKPWFFEVPELEVLNFSCPFYTSSNIIKFICVQSNKNIHDPIKVSSVGYTRIGRDTREVHVPEAPVSTSTRSKTYTRSHQSLIAKERVPYGSKGCSNCGTILKSTADFHQYVLEWYCSIIRWHWKIFAVSVNFNIVIWIIVWLYCQIIWVHGVRVYGKTRVRIFVYLCAKFG